ncbi:site-specific integrase [Bacillus subtilis]|nr:site-specific integrase [Bacillus subtilis]
MNIVSPIRDKKQLELLKMYLREKSKRDYLMFMVGISSALRISDILKLKVGDIWDGRKPKEFIYLHEEKTGKYKRFPITENLQKAIREYMKEYQLDQESYLFFSRKGNKPISRQQAAHILSSAADYIGIKEPVSTHSMRKTWGYWAYKKGYSLALIMEALNHSSIAITKKYLGITQEDLDDVYMSMNL